MTKRQTTGSKFITPNLRKSMRERDQLKEKFNKSRNHEDWEKYQLIRNTIVSMRRKALQNYFQRLCVDRYADQRKFWSTIKPYIDSRKGKQNGCIVLKDNERIIRDKREVAEILNNFFTSFGITEQSISGVKSTPNLSHIQQNVLPKHPFSLKKRKSRWTSQWATITFHQVQARNQLKYFAILSVYFLNISWKILGYLNNGKSV